MNSPKILKSPAQTSARWLIQKKQIGWKSASFVAPPSCIDALRDFFRLWKREHIQLWKDAKPSPIDEEV